MAKTRGPKPIPRNLRVITGADRKSRTNEDEPILPVIIPDPPGHLTVAESDKFIEMAGKLARMRVITEADVDALALYAVSWMRMLDADEKVREMGPIIKSPNNYPIQNPYLPISNRCRKDCESILTEFGMTPSSRTRVKAV